MRIAIAVEGSRGDVHPMLFLALSLRAEGHDVVVCGPPDFRGTIEAEGLEFRPVGTNVREYLSRNADALSGRSLTLFRAVNSYLKESVAAQFRSLPEATRDAEQIIGAGVQFAAPSVAELHGIPYRYVAYCPVLLPSAEHPSPMIQAQSLPRWLNRLSWRLLLGPVLQALGKAIDPERAKLGLAPVTDPYRYLVTERPLLAADAELAPTPTDCPFEVEQVPAFHPLEGEPLPAKLLSFLEQGPPPVYLGFGSMTDADPQSTTAQLLRALSAVGCRALISKGWAGLAAGPLPEGVMAIDSVSHAELFPRMAAVVHHGGAGTTTTAARAGVPQIVVPHILDQFYWGRRVALLGLGPPALPRIRLKREALAAALEATLENEVLSVRTREFGQRLRARLSTYPKLPESAPGEPRR